MQKKIHKSDYLEGLILCEKNVLKLLSNALEKFNLKDYLSAFIFALASFEEFGKGYMIIESWNQPHISYNKWKKKMTQHPPKFRKGKYVIDKSLRDSALSLKKKYNLPQKVFKNIPEDKYDENFVNEMKEHRERILYTDYNFDNSCWFQIMDITPKKATYSIDLATSMWLNLEWKKDELKIPRLDMKYLQQVNLSELLLKFSKTRK